MADETGMTAEKAAALRAPFPPETVGSLPKPFRKDSPKGNCHECGGYHGLPAMHLSYVGHAAVTDRLLQVDPEWTWEPMATDPQTGAPLVVNGGLWIRLTVCGVTRIGWGDSATGSVKECIGDAIRNAAMRFGVALDLWAKESLVEGQHDAPSPGVAKPDPAAQLAYDLRMKIAALATEQEWDLAVLGQEFTQTYGVSTANATPTDLAAYLDALTERVAAQPVDPASAMDGEPETATPERERGGMVSGETPDQGPSLPEETNAALTSTPDIAPGTVDAMVEEGKKRAPSSTRTPEDYAQLLRDATTKKECIALLQQLSMDGYADATVPDEHLNMVTLTSLATARMKGLR